MKKKDIIKFVKAMVSRDGDVFQEVDCAFRDKNQTLRSLNMYGISFMPPKNSFGISFNIGGYEDTAYAIVDAPKKRFTGLKEGELKIGNYETGDYVYFKADGTIEVKSSVKASVIAPTVEVSADNINAIATVEITATAPDVKIVASAKVEITSPLVEITGNLEVSGTIETLSNIISPNVPSYEGHTHIAVTPGVGISGGPQ